MAEGARDADGTDGLLVLREEDLHAHHGVGAQQLERGLDAIEAHRAAATLQLWQVTVVADALTTPYQAVRRAGVTPGSVAVVIGAGA